MISSLSLSLYMSCMGVMNGSLTAGDVVFLQTIFGMAFAPLVNLGNLYIRFQESLVELKDVVDLLTIKSEVVEKPGATDLKIVDGRIKFDNVGYTYGNK